MRKAGAGFNAKNTEDPESKRGCSMGVGFESLTGELLDSKGRGL